MGSAAAGPALFVATDLDRFETPDPDVFADDVTVSGRCYRRLDPPYYAWLRAKVALAKRALDAGRLAASAFETLRRAFNEIHAWAVRHLGIAALVAAGRAFNPRTYEPPSAEDDDLDGSFATAPRRPGGPSGHFFPSEGAWPCVEPVTADAVAKVDAVRQAALALGWSEDGLYQNRGRYSFPCGQDYGLVCFLAGDAEVGAVARESIEVRRPRGATTRFPNREVAQPWCRPVAAGVA